VSEPHAATLCAVLQVVMASSNVAGLQQKGYELSTAAQWNDTHLLPRFAAVRQRMAKQATTGLFAIRWRIIMSTFMEHCDALLGEPGLMDRMQARSTRYGRAAARAWHARGSLPAQ